MAQIRARSAAQGGTGGSAARLCKRAGHDKMPSAIEFPNWADRGEAIEDGKARWGRSECGHGKTLTTYQCREV